MAPATLNEDDGAPTSVPPPPPASADRRGAAVTAPTPRTPACSISCSGDARGEDMGASSPDVAGASDAPAHPAARAPTTAAVHAPSEAPPTTTTMRAHAAADAGARHHALHARSAHTHTPHGPPRRPPHFAPRLRSARARPRSLSPVIPPQSTDAPRRVARRAHHSSRSRPTASTRSTTALTTRFPAYTSSPAHSGTPTASRATRTLWAGASPMSTSARAAPATICAARLCATDGAVACSAERPTAPGSAARARPSAHGTCRSCGRRGNLRACSSCPRSGACTSHTPTPCGRSRRCSRAISTTRAASS